MGGSGRNRQKEEHDQNILYEEKFNKIVLLSDNTQQIPPLSSLRSAPDSHPSTSHVLNHP